MRYSYSYYISTSIDTGEEIVIMRPEVPLRIHGPNGQRDWYALIDTGADNSIFPFEVAGRLGIKTTLGRGPSPTAYGGQQLLMSYAEIVLELLDVEEELLWKTRVYFADQSSDIDTIILGHEGFLDYFTATFSGELCELELEPNDDLPRVTL